MSHIPNLDEIKKACAEYRGKILMDEEIAAMANEWACSVYLYMDHAASHVTEETAEDVLAQLSEFPNAVGLRLLDSIERAFCQIGIGTPAQISDAMSVAASAYQRRLNYLMEIAPVGGAA